MATRRDLLGRLATGIGLLACRGALARSMDEAAYVGVETSAQTGLSRARFLGASGAPLGTVPLDFRAHGLARNSGRIVVFPRRPGNRFAVIGRDRLDVQAVVTAPAGRHFYGHGAFTLDGRHLLVTENDLDTLRGGIGVYDAAGAWRRLGRIDLPGPGPHEIVRAASADLFHVALGGLQTHPDYGRTPLNLHEFTSEIVTLAFDRGSVEPLGRWPGAEGVSLRHLAMDGQGAIWVGGQVADPRRGRPENVLWQWAEGRATPVSAGARLGGYVSSVASAGDRVVASSKEAGTVVVLKSGRVEIVHEVTGASAVALAEDVTVYGGYRRLLIDGSGVGATPGYEFDNHGLIAL